MSSHRIRAALLVVGFASTLFSLPFGLPMTADAAPDARGRCNLYANIAYVSEGRFIQGSGSKSHECGRDGTSRLRVERWRGFYWQTMKTVVVQGSARTVYANYNCAGTGTYTYRTKHWGRSIGGKNYVTVSSEIRVTC
jgi:hypothetical protein